jgi:hypothetical protein
MSVPIHNLYDYIYQCLEKRYNVAYFHPFGEKELDNIVNITGNYFPSEAFFDHKNIKVPYTELDPALRPNSNSTVCKIFPYNQINSGKILESNPWVMCHDQEPLDYNFYQDANNHVDFIKNKSYNRPLSEISRTKNLRWYLPASIHKTWILLHSELQSEEVDLYNKSGLFKCAYWWSHAFLSLDWYRFAKYDNFLQPGQHIKKTFLVYCRDTSGSRRYRQEVINNLPNCCQIGSFNNKSVTSDHSAVYNTEDINHTAISLVLETVFDSRIHLTEKTLRPIACGHPFILMSGPNALSYLRKYGFKTFHPFIDESYDTELDTEKRKHKILQEIHRLSNLDSKKLNKIVDKCRNIAKHNKQIFFSEQFQTQVEREMTENVYKASDDIVDWHFIIKSRIERLRSGIGRGDPKNSQLYVPFARHIKKGGTVSDYIPPWEK